MITRTLKPPFLLTSPGGTESSDDNMETSVDAPPPKPTSTELKGLKKLQGRMKLLEDEHSAVEDKLKKKEEALAERKAAVEKYGSDIDKFHKDLDLLAEQLNTTQPVLTNDDAVKEQIGKNEVKCYLDVYFVLLIYILTYQYYYYYYNYIVRFNCYTITEYIKES